jgi:hypothetical protein
MTLIAAITINDIPVLIGDFLVTDEQRDTEHIWLATQSGLSDPLHAKLPRRVSGLKRKLHLINERFVVGFTGDVDAGAVILADLERRFRDTHYGPSIKEISAALYPFNLHYYRRENLPTVIGWTYRSRPCCSKWSAGLDASAIHVPSAIEGSGRYHFAKILAHRAPGMIISGGSALTRSKLFAAQGRRRHSRARSKASRCQRTAIAHS